MIRTFARSLALLLALAGAAAAQSARPELRGHVTVDSAIVRIGDLVANAGPVADIAIFRAPDLGNTGAVSTARVVDAIRPHQLIDIDTRGLTQVIVTRASRAIGAQEISASIAQAIAGRGGLGDPRNVSIAFDGPVQTLQVEPNALGPLHVAALNFDPRTGRFAATLDLTSSALLQRQPARYTGTAMQTVAAVTVNRPVDRGEVLNASELTIVRLPKTQAPALGAIGAAIGLAARHALHPGESLYAADLMKPLVVERNDTVTLVYRVPGLTLTLRGTAQDSGAVGDTIGVLNGETKRVVQGVVSGPGRVSVAGSTIHLADIAPAQVPAPGPASAPPQRRE
jgi:flagella basal body P-ring formation protein FlgA